MNIVGRTRSVVGKPLVSAGGALGDSRKAWYTSAKATCIVFCLLAGRRFYAHSPSLPCGLASF